MTRSPSLNCFRISSAKLQSFSFRWMARQPRAIQRRIACLLAIGLLLAIALRILTRNSNHPQTLTPGVELSYPSSDGAHYSVVRVDLTRCSLELFWKSQDNQPLLTFDRLAKDLERSGNRLVFATNAGIFSPGYTPLGLHVEDGQELVPLNLAD